MSLSLAPHPRTSTFVSSVVHVILTSSPRLPHHRLPPFRPLSAPPFPCLIAHQGKACCRFRAACPGCLTVLEHRRRLAVPSVHSTQHCLRHTTDLFAHARPSGASSDDHEVHPTLPPEDTTLQSPSVPLILLRPRRLYRR
jgi:hypothetical protein